MTERTLISQSIAYSQGSVSKESMQTWALDKVDAWLGLLPVAAYVVLIEADEIKLIAANELYRQIAGSFFDKISNQNQEHQVSTNSRFDIFHKVVSERRTCRFLEKLRWDQTIRWHYHFLNPLELGDGDVGYVLGNIFEIDGMDPQNKGIFAGHQHAPQPLLDEIPAMVASLDKNLRYKSANRNYAKAYDTTSEKLIGLHASELMGDTFLHIEPKLRTALNGVGLNFQTRIHFADRVRDVDASYVPQRDLNGEIIGCLIFILDASEGVRIKERLEQQTFYDDLTQLPNRRFAKRYIDDLILSNMTNGKPESIFVLLIDMDNFKVLNDIHGHEFGDKVLARVAKRILNGIKESDLVARLGGDEFLMVIKDAKSCDIERVERRILKKLMEPFNVDQSSYTMTVSMGVSEFPKDGKTVDKLLRKADTAMYNAKSQGRNRSVRFRTIMEDDLRNQSQLMAQLHRAVKTCDFYMVYQPVWDVAQRRVVAAEALIRWDDPVLGTVPPSQFIPVAEKSWLIDVIGEWGVTKALKDLKRFQNDLNDATFSMNINISASQLRDDSLRNRVQSLCRELGLEKSRVELEITERMLIGDVEHAAHELKELSKLGVVLAIDDFGTGYSSFGLLRDIPFATLKIDQSFIQDLPNETALVDTMIEMARLLGLKVVAEGVEQAAQMAYLTEMRCDYIQGFAFARPMSPDALVAFVIKTNGEAK